MTSKNPIIFHPYTNNVRSMMIVVVANVTGYQKDESQSIFQKLSLNLSEVDQSVKKVSENVWIIQSFQALDFLIALGKASHNLPLKFDIHHDIDF